MSKKWQKLGHWIKTPLMMAKLSGIWTKTEMKKKKVRDTLTTDLKIGTWIQAYMKMNKKEKGIKICMMKMKQMAKWIRTSLETKKIVKWIRTQRKMKRMVKWIRTYMETKRIVKWIRTQRKMKRMVKWIRTSLETKKIVKWIRTQRKMKIVHWIRTYMKKKIAN
jgi:hypothetical protein